MVVNPPYFSDRVNLAFMICTEVVKDAMKTQHCLFVNESDRFPDDGQRSNVPEKI